MAKDEIVDVEGSDEPASDPMVTGLVVFTTIALLAGMILILVAHKDNYGGGWLGS